MLTVTKRLKKATDNNNGVRLAVRQYLPKDRHAYYDKLLVALQKELNEAIKVDVKLKKEAKKSARMKGKAVETLVRAEKAKGKTKNPWAKMTPEQRLERVNRLRKVVTK